MTGKVPVEETLGSTMQVIREEKPVMNQCRKDSFLLGLKRELLGEWKSGEGGKMATSET